MILPIYTEPNPVLRKKSVLVTIFDESLQNLVENMRHTMLNAKGIGLAAIQIGEPLALFIVELSERNVEKPEPEEIIPFTVFINPRLTWKSPFKVSLPEGCLSVPGREAILKRPAKVRIKAQDQNGKRFEVKANGLLARLLQHEIEHLDGRLYIDHVKPSEIKQIPSVDYPRI